MGGHADEGRARFGRPRGSVGDAVIAAMTGMAMCFGYVPIVPTGGPARDGTAADGRTADGTAADGTAADGSAAPAAPVDARPRTWRDDQAFAVIVEPLAGDLRWRLRVRRLVLRTAVRPALRVTAMVGGLVAAVGGAATSVVFLGASLADAYGAPVRWALRPFA